MTSKSRATSKPAQAHAATPATHAQLFFYGCVGAIAPDILQLYTKRWTAPSLEFSLTQYMVATILYVLLGGVLGMLFAYQGRRQAALAVGIGTPVVIGAMVSTIKVATVVTQRGVGAPQVGSLLDLLSLF